MSKMNNKTACNASEIAFIYFNSNFNGKHLNGPRNCPLGCLYFQDFGEWSHVLVVYLMVKRYKCIIKRDIRLWLFLCAFVFFHFSSVCFYQCRDHYDKKIILFQFEWETKDTFTFWSWQMDRDNARDNARDKDWSYSSASRRRSRI